MQLKRIGPAFDRIYRMEQNSNLEKIEQANSTLESKMDALISGKIDDVALQADIEQKLNDLEAEYAPKLTEVETDLLIKTSSIPKVSIFGGQLSKLKESLSNPFVQFVGIVFLGDSITWGRTLPENGVFEPRDGTLSDPRDLFTSPSFVNEFKRYIGTQYANNVTPTLSNWSASPSGESIVEYTVQHILYPNGGDVSTVSNGSNVSVTEVQTSASITGYQYRLNDGNVSGTSYQGLKFNFTGDSFTLSFACLESDATYYDLYIGGALHGTFSTHAGTDGFIDGRSDQRRTHTFPYVRDTIVEIRTNRNGESGNRRLRIEAIIINKKIRISNQGINGATTRSHTLYNLAGNTYRDGEAVGVDDQFVFIQLGTNDRLISSSVPKGSNTFKVNLKKLLDKVTPLSDVILMCANPATENSNSYSFTMQGARDVIYRTAKENSFDMIDNFAVFEGVNLNQVTTDGVHPNKLGHQMIARNIINSLESS